MADYWIEVGVSKLTHLTARVQVEAPNPTQAAALARAKVRRVLVDGKTEQLLITEAGRPTYQLHEAQVADGPGAA